jgi:hypothetical protein
MVAPLPTMIQTFFVIADAFSVNACIAPVILVSLTAFSAVVSHAQLQASASVSLSARLPGSINLRQREVPVLITVLDGKQECAASTVDVSWNLDPRETESFRVIATLLSDSPLLSDNLLVTVDGNDLRPLSSTSRKIVLFNVPIRFNNRQGTQQHLLRFRLADGSAELFKTYRATLSLKVEQQ